MEVSVKGKYLIGRGSKIRVDGLVYVSSESSVAQKQSRHNSGSKDASEAAALDGSVRKYSEDV